MKITVILLIIFVAVIAATSFACPHDFDEGNSDSFPLLPPSNWRNHRLHNSEYHTIVSKLEAKKREFKLPEHVLKANIIPTPAFTKDGKPNNNETCGMCQLAISDGLKDMTNVTDLLEMEAMLFKTCHKVFANKTADKVICDVVPNIAIFVAELLVNRFHFNVPNIVCADFLKTCVENCCSTPHQPEQLHLSFDQEDVVGGPYVSWRVSWVTLKNTTTGAAQVWYKKKTDNNNWQTGDAISRTYNLGGWVGVIWSAPMVQLEPGTTYQYYVGDKDLGVSQVFEFRTLPTNVGSPERPLRVLGLADMGFGKNAQPSIKRMKSIANNYEVDFFVWPGDILYADGDQQWWDVGMREMEDVMARIPMLMQNGNHERFFWNARSYRARFFMPHATPAPGQPALPADTLFYKARAGPVTFFMVDSESVINTPEITNTQQHWLATSMPIERAAKKFIFTAHHRPLYCDSGTDDLLAVECNEFADYLIEKLEDIYHKNQVAVCMVGHLHNYQRTYPVYKRKLVSKTYDNVTATTYFVNGGPGNREGNGNFEGKTEQDWSAFRTRERSFMLYNFSTSSGGNVVSMKTQLIRSTTGEVLDSFTISQNV